MLDHWVGGQSSMAKTFANLLYHLVFSTKERLPSINEDLSDSLYGYIGGIIRDREGILLEAGGMPDHVHLLAKFKTTVTVSAMLQDIKGVSSKWMNERPDQRERFEWQEGYGAFTVSESQVTRLRKYIQNQKEHHQRISFKDELITLLRRHRISYDERYLLG